MPDDIRVISSALDGAQLRREKLKTSKYSRCSGKADNEEIQEALNGAGKPLWSIPPERWQQIFGGK